MLPDHGIERVSIKRRTKVEKMGTSPKYRMNVTICIICGYLDEMHRNIQNNPTGFSVHQSVCQCPTCFTPSNACTHIIQCALHNSLVCIEFWHKFLSSVLPNLCCLFYFSFLCLNFISKCLLFIFSYLFCHASILSAY